ncbi:MAG: hypothetical protein ACOX8T_12250 [Bacillota bacterium]|jgi:hypothetical protein
MTELETRRLDEKLEVLDDKMDTLNTRIARIETLLETEAARCPFREAISAAADVVKRVEKAENRLVQLEIRVAAIGGTAGIVMGVVTSLIISAIKGAP